MRAVCKQHERDQLACDVCRSLHCTALSSLLLCVCVSYLLFDWPFVRAQMKRRDVAAKVAAARQRLREERRATDEFELQCATLKAEILAHPERESAESLALDEEDTASNPDDAKEKKEEKEEKEHKGEKKAEDKDKEKEPKEKEKETKEKEKKEHKGEDAPAAVKRRATDPRTVRMLLDPIRRLKEEALTNEKRQAVWIRRHLCVDAHWFVLCAIDVD